MHPRSAVAVFVLAALGSAASGALADPAQDATNSAPSGPAHDAPLSEVNALFDEAYALLRAGDREAGRAKTAAAVERALVVLGEREDPAAIAAFDRLARLASTARDLRTFDRMASHLLEVYSRTLTDDHPNLQAMRGNVGWTASQLGDHPRARVLCEKVVEVWSRTRPDDDPMLVDARSRLAFELYQVGEYKSARAHLEWVVEVRTSTLPEADLSLQEARAMLAQARYMLGDIHGARDLLERVLANYSHTLPEADQRLQSARQRLAAMLYYLGDLEGARVIEEQKLEVALRAHPADHPDVLMARTDLANTLVELGDRPRARTLYEESLEIASRTLPDDHDSLQVTRQALAVLLISQGDLEGARALREKVLAVYSRTHPADHLDVQGARLGMVELLRSMGDLESARTLNEQVIDVLARTMPADYYLLQSARGDLAMTLRELGDWKRAREIEEQVLEVVTRTRPDDDKQLQRARWSAAQTIVVACASTHPDEAELERSRQRCAELLGALCRSQTSTARAALLAGAPREAEARCRWLTGGLDYSISVALGLGAFPPVPELEGSCFVLSETTRGAALASAAFLRLAASAPRYAELRSALAARSGELAALAERGTTSDEFRDALARREAVEHEIASLAKEASVGAPKLEVDVDALAAGLAERDAIVVYRRFRRTLVARPAAAEPPATEMATETFAENLGAFVVRRASRPLCLVDLGRIEPIEDAVHAWRESLGTAARDRGMSASRPSEPAQGTDERGRELRRLVLDPLREALAGADHVVVVLDDVLHLVPLDAVPGDGSASSVVAGDRLGDHLRIETRVTLIELLASSTAAESGEELLVVGGVAYGGAATPAAGAPATTSSATLPATPATTSTAAPAPELAAAQVERSDEHAGILRGGAWSGGFADLPATAAEARSIAHEFAARESAQPEVTLLEGPSATRERFLESAPRASWLHVATHGWFAAESIRSWQDAEPVDKVTGIGMRASGVDQVKGMSPMLLCGLAFAGANLSENEGGRVPGLITAEEISALDLSKCELAVLSACDTNVGERRAGQGVASLQMALQMAGARSVITSLWKVPDEATKDLMLDFYRRLWVEKKPKHQALWEAKTKLREAKDERGAPKYTTRDWAAWVLTGDPQ